MFCGNCQQSPKLVLVHVCDNCVVCVIKDVMNSCLMLDLTLFPVSLLAGTLCTFFEIFGSYLDMDLTPGSNPGFICLNSSQLISCVSLC